jgi:mRNA interferase HigB
LGRGGGSKAEWQQPADVEAVYRSASVLKNRRVVFNIKGNEYRLIVAIAYRVGVVYVKFIGTHAQYDAVDAETVELRSVDPRRRVNALGSCLGASIVLVNPSPYTAAICKLAARS